MTTVIITQSNYLPWRGYFDLIRRGDLLVTFDVAQYTRRDWRNRNMIKAPGGRAWLTIPVQVKGRYSQAIDEVVVADPGWSGAHCRSLEANYGNAPRFDVMAPLLTQELRALAGEPYLSRINERLLRVVCDLLAIQVPIKRCTDFVGRDALVDMKPSERLIAIAQATGATTYLTGPSARAYLDLDAFGAAGISVEWMSFHGYPVYPQQFGAFEPQVSIVDLLLNTGKDAGRYLTQAAG